ncbi:MAG TPA: DUF6325 family protein [Solirubrobacterales bacterium]|nr:DUF6325 family protein [Thermoleophilia bacterium]HVO54578.1 DUF6325 family protein [Solirubrobacterales bacterium]
MTEIGPVQMIAIGFGPGTGTGETILESLAELEGERTVRVLDILFVDKDAETGDLIAGELQGEDLGGIVGALLGFDFDDVESRPAEGNSVAGQAYGLAEDQVRAVADALDPGTSAGVVLIEHVWARDLKAAACADGGVVLAEGLLTPEAISAVALELSAMAHELDELEGDT